MNQTKRLVGIFLAFAILLSMLTIFSFTTTAKYVNAAVVPSPETSSTLINAQTEDKNISLFTTMTDDELIEYRESTTISDSANLLSFVNAVDSNSKSGNILQFSYAKAGISTVYLTNGIYDVSDMKNGGTLKFEYKTSGTVGALSFWLVFQSEDDNPATTEIDVTSHIYFNPYFKSKADLISTEWAEFSISADYTNGGVQDDNNYDYNNGWAHGKNGTLDWDRLVGFRLRSHTATPDAYIQLSNIRLEYTALKEAPTITSNKKLNENKIYSLQEGRYNVDTYELLANSPSTEPTAFVEDSWLKITPALNSSGNVMETNLKLGTLNGKNFNFSPALQQVVTLNIDCEFICRTSQINSLQILLRNSPNFLIATYNNTTRSIVTSDNFKECVYPTFKINDDGTISISITLLLGHEALSNLGNMSNIGILIQGSGKWSDVYPTNSPVDKYIGFKNIYFSYNTPIESLPEVVLDGIETTNERTYIIQDGKIDSTFTAKTNGSSTFSTEGSTAKFTYVNDGASSNAHNFTLLSDKALNFDSAADHYIKVFMTAKFDTDCLLGINGASMLFGTIKPEENSATAGNGFDFVSSIYNPDASGYATIGFGIDLGESTHASLNTETAIKGLLLSTRGNVEIKDLYFEYTIPSTPDASTYSLSTLGAQVRLDNAGFRFVSQIPTDAYNQLVETFGEDNIVLGTLLIKKDLASGQVTINTPNILNIESQRFYTQDSDYSSYTGVIASLATEDYNTTYICVAYIKINDFYGSTVYVYGTQEEKTPSIVAQAAFNDPSDKGYQNDYLKLYFE
mgnify:CR=1 FL=1